MKDVIIFDLDGTLSIVGDRLKYLKDNDWDSFYEACEEDEPNEPIINIFFELFMRKKYDIKIVTGRRESVKNKTLNWLHDQGIFIKPHNLYMRPDGDYRHDTKLKPELVKDFVDDIVMVFEDRTSMVNKWRAMGICCLQVAKGDF